MKRTLIGAALAAAVVLAVPAAAQMMGGWGGYGPGYGMGPGMMGGYGPGYGMGPGMMWGHGAGRGMMWDYGPGGYGLGALNLSDEQRGKIAEIQEGLAEKRWSLMSGIHEQFNEAYGSGKADDAAARKAFQAMQTAQKQMFEAGLDARKRIDALLSPEQRKQFNRSYNRWGMW